MTPVNVTFKKVEAAQTDSVITSGRLILWRIVLDVDAVLAAAQDVVIKNAAGTTIDELTLTGSAGTIGHPVQTAEYGCYLTGGLMITTPANIRVRVIYTPF